MFDTLLGATPGVSGTGVLAHFKFQALAPGASTLTFSDVLLLDSQFNGIDSSPSIGNVVAVTEPVTLTLVVLGLLSIGRTAHRERESA